MESPRDLAASVPDLIIDVPDRRRRVFTPLPQPLADEIDHWLTYESAPRRHRKGSRASTRDVVGRHVRDSRRRREPLASRTVKTYRVLLREFISMQIKCGVHPVTLGDVVDLDNVDRGLSAYEAHFGGAKRKHLGQVMRVVCVLAGRWVKVADDHLAELQAWTREASSSERYGMSESTKSAVLALRDLRILANLLFKPGEILRAICAKPHIGRKDAVLASRAFMTQFVLNAPERIANASAVHVDENLRQVDNGPHRRVFVEYPALVVKTKVDLRYELTPETIELLDLYLTKIRPKLMRNKNSRWLFPGESDGPKSKGLVSSDIADFTKKHVGQRFTAHRLRAAAGYIHLRQTNNDTLTVKTLLGHKQLATTEKYYIHITQDEAVQAYDRSLKLTQEELKSQIVGSTPQTRRKRST